METFTLQEMRTQRREDLNLRGAAAVLGCPLRQQGGSAKSDTPPRTAKLVPGRRRRWVVMNMNPLRRDYGYAVAIKKI